MAIITSKLAKVVALEIAKKAPFLKIGSKDYFSDQINGKMKAGKSYDFVIPDAGNVVSNSMTANPREIEEKSVNLTIQTYNNSVETGVLDEVTDLKWEEEIAETYAAKLINKILSDNVGKAMAEPHTAFIGYGFQPIAKAGALVQSLTTDEVVGFIDPMAQATLASNGQSFTPAGSPNDLYSKGHLGIFQGVDYSAERFIKPVVVSDAVVAALEGATATLADGKVTVTLGSSVTVPAGTPIMVEGLFACDTVGDNAGSLRAFIVKEDTTGSTLEFDVVDEDIGARNVIGEASGAKVISFAEAGTYRRSLVRAKGAYCFSPVTKLDFKVSEKYSAQDVDGINVMVNQFSNGIEAKNLTRWDMCFLAGIVEPRACSVAYFKD